ncbi:MAG: hypothetical protein LBE44_02185 [Microbacterium hominis]|nr:hypothetical protein [Microbacterium hominis]
MRVVQEDEDATRPDEEGAADEDSAGDDVGDEEDGEDGWEAADEAEGDDVLLPESALEKVHS